MVRPECEEQIEWVASPLCTCCGRVFADREGADRGPRGLPDGPAPLRPGSGRGPLRRGPVAQAITRFKSPASWPFSR